MPFTDLKGATRLVERIDEILALVRSWPISPQHSDVIDIPEAPSKGLMKFEELDAKIGGLMSAMRLGLPPQIVWPSMHPKVHGFTELQMLNMTRVHYVPEWERRLIGLKYSVLEILDVAASKEDEPRFPDNVDVRDLCAKLAKESPSGKPLLTIARDFTREKPGKDKKARSLLRQAQRFGHLWKGADK